MIATAERDFRSALSRTWAEAAATLLAAGFAVYLVTSGVEPYRGFVALACVGVLLFIAVRDVRTMKARNRVVLPAIALALVLTVPLGTEAFLEAASGGTAAFALFLVIALVGRGAMGFGDVKVATLCGITVGLGGLLPFIFITFLLGTVFAAVVLALSLRSRKDVVPFTPFTTLGVLASLVLYPLYLAP